MENRIEHVRYALVCADHVPGQGMRAPAANQLNLVALMHPVRFELFHRLEAVSFPLAFTSFELAVKLWLHPALLSVQVSLLILEEILAKVALHQ